MGDGGFARLHQKESSSYSEPWGKSCELSAMDSCIACWMMSSANHKIWEMCVCVMLDKYDI